MIVWAGLLVGLASSLVACLSKLKYLRGIRLWSRRFVFLNRFPLVTAVLAVLGFLVAAMGVRENEIKSAEKEQDLRYRNQQLQALALQDKAVSPAIRFTWDTADSELSTGRFEEWSRWNEGRDNVELPRAIGFVPSRLRSSLFPGAQPEPLLRYLGAFEVRTGRHEWRFIFRVRDDGTVINGSLSPSSQLQRADVEGIDGSIASFEMESDATLDALGLFHSIVRAYEQKTAPIVFRVFVGDSNAPLTRDLVRAFEQRSGRITVFLDERKQLAVTAMLNGASVTEATSEHVYEWEFSEPPRLEVLLPGGLQ